MVGMVEMEMTMFSLKVLIASLKGSWRQVGWYTSNRLEQYNFKLLSSIDQHHHGLPAYSHHDKIPPWWGNVSNDKGGNVSVSNSHHT